MNNEPVKAAAVTSTGTVVTTNGRLRSLVIRDTGAAGTVVLKDGGSGGAELLTINSPGNVGVEVIPIPGAGVGFGTDVHATLTNVDGLTIFYADDSRGSVP